MLPQCMQREWQHAIHITAVGTDKHVQHEPLFLLFRQDRLLRFPALGALL